MTPASYAFLLFTAAAIGHGILFILLLLSGRFTQFKLALLWLCGITVGTCAALAAGLDNVLGPTGAIAEVAITGGWCAFAIYLLNRGRREKGHLFLFLVAAAASVVIFGLALLPSDLVERGYIAHQATLAVYARLSLAVIGLLATENLYRNTASESRWHVKLLCFALASIFIYTIIIYADTLLFRRMSGLLWAGRGVVIAASAPLLAITAARNPSWAIDIHVSRNAVFHSATLIGCGIFLLALAAVGEVLRTIGAGWGELAEITFIVTGIVGAGVLATSGSARSRLRRMLADNFYSNRYDYRQEWLKSIDILSAELRSDSVQTRVIKAVAEIVDSPAGVLWVRDLDGTTFNWAGSWNQPAIGFSESPESSVTALFRNGDWVVEVDHCHVGPAWLAEFPEAWLAVPLAERGSLIGFIVLSRPRAPFQLDRETFDLLRIVARHAAIHIAEEQNARALAESKELREFGKRFAFVAHDLKNVTSQLSMILQNAASHRQDPEFHEDVLATVRAALSRIKKLLASLQSRQPAAAAPLIVPIDLVREQVAAICRVHGPKIIHLQCDGGSAAVSMDPGAFRSVLAHLCDNAIEASAGHVQIWVRHEPPHVKIEVADRGHGMKAEFIRDRLFQPFGSTKKHGMGIGAYQARELVRAAGGDLTVTSRPGAGTRICILLPCTTREPSHQKISASGEAVR